MPVCNFPEGIAQQIDPPVLQNNVQDKVQNKFKAECYTHPCVLIKGE